MEYAGGGVGVESKIERRKMDGTERARAQGTIWQGGVARELRRFEQKGGPELAAGAILVVEAARLRQGETKA